jgi:hypothetical protein
MGQVSNVGTGGTFAADARQLGLDQAEQAQLVQKVRAWYVEKESSPDEGKCRTTIGGRPYEVQFKHSKPKNNLTCLSVKKAVGGGAYS